MALEKQEQNSTNMKTKGTILCLLFYHILSNSESNACTFLLSTEPQRGHAKMCFLFEHKTICLNELYVQTETNTCICSNITLRLNIGFFVQT